MKKIGKLLGKGVLLLLVTFTFIGFGSQLISESTWFTSSFSYLFAKDNFHEVVPGLLYRSATLDKEEFIENVKKHNIKTVIDLRKGGDEAKLEDQGFSERNLSEELGANYEWIPMVGSNTRQKQSLEKLIEISEKTEGPVLIHCSSGTHRSGVVTAIWLMLKDEEPPEDAAKQLSSEYGFFYWERKLKSFFLGHETIDGIIWHYLKNYRATGISFKEWFFNQEGEEL